MNTRTKRTSLIVACSLALWAVPGALANKDADKHLAMMDANNDGRISRTEHAAGAKKMFAQSDANGDQVLTASELDAAMATHGRMPGKGDKSSAEKIQVIDQDGDGQVTAAEHEASSEKMFTKMDKDSDGSLSKEECDEGMKMKRKGT